jgi:hypothetical protein
VDGHGNVGLPCQEIERVPLGPFCFTNSGTSKCVIEKPADVGLAADDPSQRSEAAAARATTATGNVRDTTLLPCAGSGCGGDGGRCVIAPLRHVSRADQRVLLDHLAMHASDGVPATDSGTVSGRFTSSTGSGLVTRETKFTYPTPSGGVPLDCTSGNVTWNAVRTSP